MFTRSYVFWGTLLLVLIFSYVLTGCGGSGGGGSHNTGRISGTIDIASLGSDVQNVVVLIDGKEISAQVRDDGSFALENVPAGVYTLVAKTAQKAGAIVVVVEGGEETNIGQMELRRAGQIAGLITSAKTSEPIPEASVTVTELVYTTTDETPHPVRLVTTNTNGSYVVDALAEGEYLVTIAKSGFISSTLYLYVYPGSTTTGDAAMQEIDPTSGSLKGSVLSVGEDGTVSPLGGVFIQLVPESSGIVPLLKPVPAVAYRDTKQRMQIYQTDPSWQEYYTYSRDDGIYNLDGIPAGNYIATAMRPGFESISQAVAITTGQTATLDFKLALLHIPTGVVTGTVIDASTNKPVAGANVYANSYEFYDGPVSGGTKPVTALPPSRDGDMSMSATTDSNGVYKILVPTSTRSISCWADGYDWQEKEVSIVENGSITVDISLMPIEPNPNIDVTLSGLVQKRTEGSTDGLLPVAGATVRLTLGSVADSSDPRVPPYLEEYKTATDENGKYSITVPSNIYYVYADKDGMMSNSVDLRLYKDAQQDFILYSNVVIGDPGSTGSKKAGK